jgi:hypothetical protein
MTSPLPMARVQVAHSAMARAAWAVGLAALSLLLVASGQETVDVRSPSVNVTGGTPFITCGEPDT